MKKLLSIATLIIFSSAYPQLNPNQVVHFADSMMQHGINTPMIPGGILSIVSADSMYHVQGYGFSNYPDKKTVDPVRTLFQLGSVGKVFTAISVLQQIEKGNLELRKNVNDYLSNWKIENPYDEDVTLFNLLTHTAGFNDHVIGYMARSEKEIVSLNNHLKGNMPSLFQAPGTNINYSNYSYALAGHLVELVSNQHFTDYIKANVFEKIGMLRSTYSLPDNYQEKENYARGYQWRETFEEVSSFPRHPIPAGSLNSTAADMALFMQALLKEDSSLLSKESFQLLTNHQFSNSDLLTGYSLGMEIQNFNGQPAIAKGGQIPGFLSILLLFPKDDLGIFISLNTETDNFLELFFEAFKQQFFPTSLTAKKRMDADVSEYVGHYGSLRTNHETIEELFMLYEGNFEFFKSSNNNLTAYHNGKWNEYLMVEKDVFQNKDNPLQYVVFERNSSGNLKNMYRNVSVGGIQIPASYRLLGWFERPRFMNDEYPVLLMVIPSYLLLLFGWIFTYFVRKRNSTFLLKAKISPLYHSAALLFLLLFFWNLMGFFLPLLQNRTELFFDFNQSLLSMRYFNWAMAITALGLLILAIRLWIRKEGNWIMRLYYSCYSLVAFSYILVLHQWHFLNITYQ